MSSLHCWAFAWLNDCANGDEADFTYVQTQKTQSHYYIHSQSRIKFNRTFLLSLIFTFVMTNRINEALRGNWTPNQKLPCHLKIINTFLKYNSTSYTKLSKEMKNEIEILVGPAVFKLWIEIVKILFWSIPQELLGLLNFNAMFEFLGQFTIRCIYYFSKRCWWFWDRV